MKVNFKKFCHEAVIPNHQTDGSAGLDLTAVSIEKKGFFFPKYIIDTKLGVEIPDGCYGSLVPRSSIHKKYMRIANSPGTIDSDYRGPLKVVFRTSFLGQFFKSKLYQKGDRVAQLIIQEYKKVTPVEVYDMDGTDRGDKGFGSTGQK